MTESTTHSPNNLKNNQLSLPKKALNQLLLKRLDLQNNSLLLLVLLPNPRQLYLTPPPAENPIEEPNIWCEILKLDGHLHENKMAEGFQTWLKKTIDSSLFEVQRNMYLFFTHLHFNILISL